MDYINALKDLLRPLGVYELDVGMGAAELVGIGSSLNEICAEQTAVESECFVQTASSYGLTMLEELLPVFSPYSDASSRRKALSALLSIDDTYFTEKALNNALRGCGIDARVRETGEKYVVEVDFPTVRGVPQDFDAVKERIEILLPCHIEVNYIYTYISWNEAQTWFSSWGDIEEKCSTWSDLTGYMPL